MAGAAWTPREDEILRERYPDEPAAAVATAIGRSLRAVYYRASQLGLAKSGVFLASQASGRADLAGRGLATRFTKGGPAWNKGIKGATGHHPNSRRTQFKKGCMTGAAQHNYQPIGTLRINKGVLERKVTDDPGLYPAQRWRPVARIVWEQAHGPIPEGHSVVFKPGRATTDPERITPEVLELISRRDLMLRNSRHTRYPPELNQLIQLKGALNRKINNRTRGEA